MALSVPCHEEFELDVQVHVLSQALSSESKGESTI